MEELLMPKIKPLDIGDTAYYEIIKGFIVPVKILEIDIWFTINNDNHHYSKDSDGQYIDGVLTDDALKMLEQASSKSYTFYWIDEFIGHSITLDSDPHERLCLTLNEAFKSSFFTSPRRAKRRHKKIADIRRSMIYWLNISRKKSGSIEVPGWQELLRERNKKKIYVKIGKPSRE